MIKKNLNGENEIIIAGAGISGCTIARILAENGYKVTIYEKRGTIGGNIYDFSDENGIRIQKYGPHIFHTNHKEVFDFLSKFTIWHEYRHKVKGNIDGKLVPIPFNLTAVEELFDKDKADHIISILKQEIGLGKKVPIIELKKHSDINIRKFADFVFEKVFYHYTYKQWGFAPENLGKDAISRVPVSISYEDGYFADKYQYQPENGYTELIQNMLNHENIKVILNRDILSEIAVNEHMDRLLLNGEQFFGKFIYTGCIEDLFKNSLGELDYRTLDFLFETHDTPSYQDAAVVNYNTSEEFTRISEFTKFACEKKEKTVIVKEYSRQFKKDDIPYYPIPTIEAREKYLKYYNLAQKIDNLYLLGRLAEYKYVNMDIAVKNAMELADKIINK